MANASAANEEHLNAASSAQHKEGDDSHLSQYYPHSPKTHANQAVVENAAASSLVDAVQRVAQI